MALSPDEVRFAYRLLLDRVPSEADCTAMMAQHDSLRTLRQAMLNAPEFRLRYHEMQARLQAGAEPVTVFLHTPFSGAQGLVDLLAGQAGLQPWTTVGDVTEFRALPPPRQKALRFIEGPLPHGAAATLDRPVRYVGLLRRPEARIYDYWQHRMRAEALPEPGMGFGDFLEAGLEDAALRQFLDNGQTRQFAGSEAVPEPGEERAVLRQALSAALGPDTLCGTAERLHKFARLLIIHGLLDDRIDLSALTPPAPLPGDVPDALSDRQSEILTGYCAWDTYLYDVCDSLTDRPERPR